MSFEKLHARGPREREIDERVRNAEAEPDLRVRNGKLTCVLRELCGTLDAATTIRITRALASVPFPQLGHSPFAAFEQRGVRDVATMLGVRPEALPGTAMYAAAERRAATLCRHAIDDGEIKADDPVVDEALARIGGGQPLPAELREEMEAQLGISLARVRVHTDEVAADAARSIRARAFTVGEDIFFATGAYAPTSATGKQLIAHELAHVVQAWEGRMPSGGGRRVSTPNDAIEHEADAVAARVGHAIDKPRQLVEPAPIAGSPMLARKEEPEVTATGFVDGRPFFDELFRAIEQIGVIRRGPYGNDLDHTQFTMALQAYIQRRAIRANGIEQFIEPDRLEPLVDRARKLHTEQRPDTANAKNITVTINIGPATSNFSIPVAIEVANAFARHYIDSVRRVFPAFVAHYIEHQAREAALGGAPLEPFGHQRIVVPTHPMDSAVIDALYTAVGEQPFGIPSMPMAEIVKRYPDLQQQFAEKHKSTLDHRLAGPVDRPTAINFKASAGQFHWVEAVPTGEDRGTRTATEVAKALFAGTADAPPEEYAHQLIALPPLWGFRSDHVPLFKPEHRTALQVLWANTYALVTWPGDITYHFIAQPGVRIPRGVDIDPMAELTSKPRTAIEHAKQLQPQPAPGSKDDASVAQALTIARKLLAQVGKLMKAMFRNTFAVDAADARLLSRYDEATSTNSCMVDPEAAWLLADRQAAVLGTIAENLTTIAARRQAHVQQIDMVFPVIDECIQPFEHALVALDFPEVARDRLAVGTKRVRAIDISLAELMLHTGDAQVHDQIQGNHSDAAPKLAQSAMFEYELAALRMELDKNPVETRRALGEKTEGIVDLQFDIGISSKLLQLEQVWRVIDEEDSFWWSSTVDRVTSQIYQGESKALRKRFIDEVKTPFETAKAAGDKAGMARARESFAKLLDVLRPFLEKVSSFITDQAKRKRWAKVVVSIAIGVAAFALGQFALASVVADIGLAGAVVVGGTTALTTQVALERLILGHKPTAGSLIVGFFGNIAMFGAMAKLAMAAKGAGVAAELAEGASVAANTSKAIGAFEAGQAGDKLVRTAAAFTQEVVIAEAIGLVQGETQSLIDNGRLLTEDELGELALMGVANVIGSKVFQYPLDVTIDAFKGQRAAKGVDIDALIAARELLKQKGKQLHEAAGGAHGLANGKAPRAHAQELLDQWHHYFELERQTVDKLLALADQHPDAFAAKAKELSKLRGVSGNAESMLRQFRETQALLGLEAKGPNLFLAEHSSIDVLLSQHKALGNELVGVATDSRTGARTLTIKDGDGTLFEIIEKLPDVADRKAPAISVGTARFFEEWLAKFDTGKPDTLIHKQRLLEYYARDPQAAVELATQRYGFDLSKLPETNVVAHGEPTAPVPGDPAARAYDHYLYTREQVSKDQSHFTDDKVMNRSDFERMYERGLEYDPVSRVWLPRKGVTTTTRMAEMSGAGTHIVGEVHSVAVGHEVMRMLVSGDTNGLRAVGVEPPPGFDSRTMEWGLGRAADGKIVLIRGGGGAVDWSLLPGIKDLAHSHPLIDPVTGQPRHLTTGAIDLNALQPGVDPSPRILFDLVFLLPSTGDFRFVALNRRAGHRVHTPYVYLGDGKIGNPVEGSSHPTVEIVIASAEPVGLLGNSDAVFRGELHLWAGDQHIGSLEVFSRFEADMTYGYDYLSLAQPAGMQPLPANHAYAQYLATPANRSPLGKLSGDAAARVLANAPASLHPKLEPILKHLTHGEAELVSELALHPRVEAFHYWLEGLVTNPALKASRLAELEAARRALLGDPALVVTIDGDGRATWDGHTYGGPKSAKVLEAEAQKTSMGRARQDQARTKAIAHLENRLGTGRRAVERWIDRVDEVFEAGKPGAPTRFYTRLLGLKDPKPFIDEVGTRFLPLEAIPTDLRGPLLVRSLNTPDPVQFLGNVRWLVTVNVSAQARVNLLKSAIRGTLDLPWLRSLTIDPHTLDALAQRTNIPWNKFKEARDAALAGDTEAATRANKASNLHIRGVAGELVARESTIEGYTVGERGPAQADKLEPDYMLKPTTKDRPVGELEVKASDPDKLRADLEEAERLGDLTKVSSDNTLPRMVKQLKGAIARGHESYLAISDGVSEPTLHRLFQFLRAHDALPKDFVLMKEADIVNTGRAIRQQLGVPEPFAKPTKAP